MTNEEAWRETRILIGLRGHARWAMRQGEKPLGNKGMLDGQWGKERGHWATRAYYKGDEARREEREVGPMSGEAFLLFPSPLLIALDSDFQNYFVLFTQVFS